MGDPKVSIVISTFNRSAKLKVAISSILMQNYANYEIVIVNDGSQDGTKEYLDTIDLKADLKIIHNKINLGLPKCLNIGVRAATGSLIARLDDDDRWIDPDKLKKQVSFLLNNKEYGLIGTNYRVGDKVHWYPITDQEIRQQMLFRCPFRHSTVVFYKDAWKNVGEYDENLPYSEDWDLWLRIGLTNKFINFEDVTAEIQEGNNLTSRFFVKQIPLNIRIIRQFKNDYPGYSRAIIYHKFLAVFFKIIPLHSPVHRLFQKIFLKVFSRK